MIVNRKIVADKLATYLRGEITLAALVDWAENALFEGEIEFGHEDAIMEVLTQLGAADVQGYGITWQDCAQMLKQLGFTARVEILAAC